MAPVDGASKAKRVAIVLAVNVVLLAIGIVVVELAFGDWIGERDLNRLNLIRDRTLTHDVSELYESPRQVATYTRDEFGLRGDFEDPCEIDILTVGGSTTDQRFVSDRETWQAVLQEEFRRNGEDVRVANAGVDGQSTFGHIMNFDWWFPHIPRLRPRVILFYVGLNDFYKREGYDADQLVTPEEDRSFRGLLAERSAIYNLVRTLYGVYRAEVALDIGHMSVDFDSLAWVSEPLQSTYGPTLERQLDEYAGRLRILIRKSEQLGATPVLVTQPARRYRWSEGAIEGVARTFTYVDREINGVDYYRIMSRLNDVTCSVAEAHGAVCLDLAAEMLPHLDDEDFYDFGHMTPRGARKVGKHLFRALDAAGLGDGLGENGARRFAACEAGGRAASVPSADSGGPALAHPGRGR